MSSRLFFKEGSIGGIFGVNGGASGTGFGGPTANPADPTGNANLANSYNQLQQVAQGNGPNPAMAQYNQNIQNQAKQQAGAISSVQGERRSSSSSARLDASRSAPWFAITWPT